MKCKTVFFSLFLIFIFFTANSAAQNKEDKGWKAMINFQFGAFIEKTSVNWSYSFTKTYPSPPERTSIYEEYNFNRGEIFIAGLELSKGYIGLQSNFGFVPANINFIRIGSGPGFAGEEKKEFGSNTYYIEEAFLFSPTGNGVGKYSPFLSVGIGMCNAYTAKRAFSLFFGGGMKMFFTDKYGLIITIKTFHADFGELDSRAKSELKLSPVQVSFGFIYRIN
jgi:hypothetical protein